MISIINKNRIINKLIKLNNLNNVRYMSNMDIYDTFQSFTNQISVNDILNRKSSVHNLCSVANDVSASKAVEHMANSNVGSVAVCQSRHVVGIFTERDYMRKIGAVDDITSSETIVSDVMTSNVVVVTPTSSLFDCAAYMMGPISFRHLPVVQDMNQKYLVDMISIKDILAEIKHLVDETAELPGQGAKYSHLLDLVTAGDLMAIHQREPQLISVQMDNTVREALRTMSYENVGSTAVMNNEEFVGIFTERDFLKKCMLLGRKSNDTKVGEVMTSAPTVVNVSDSLSKCLDLFVTGGFRHLPVHDGASPVVGMISIQDIMRALMTAE